MDRSEVEITFKESEIKLDAARRVIIERNRGTSKGSSKQAVNN